LALALFDHHVAASVEHEAVLASLGPLGLIVNIGANRGQFALLAHYCSPNLKIIFFEPLPLPLPLPLPVPAQIYCDVFAGDERVTLFQSAIGLSQSNVQMHVSSRDDS